MAARIPSSLRTVAVRTGPFVQPQPPPPRNVPPFRRGRRRASWRIGRPPRERRGRTRRRAGKAGARRPHGAGPPVGGRLLRPGEALRDAWPRPRRARRASRPAARRGGGRGSAALPPRLRRGAAQRDDSASGGSGGPADRRGIAREGDGSTPRPARALVGGAPPSSVQSQAMARPNPACRDVADGSRRLTGLMPEALIMTCISVATVPGLRPTTRRPWSRYSLSAQRVSDRTAAFVAQ
jgi:hypothetical protein